jgi:hypothetical protein
MAVITTANGNDGHQEEGKRETMGVCSSCERITTAEAGQQRHLIIISVFAADVEWQSLTSLQSK